MAITVTTAATASTLYSRIVEFPALRLRSAELQHVLSDISVLVADSNKLGSKTTDDHANSLNFEEWLQLGRGDATVKANGHTLPPPGTPIDDPTSFEYTFFTTEDHPISRVSLSFNSNWRRVEIAGTSREHVEALYSSLSGYLATRSTNFGGFGFQLMSSMMIGFVGLVLTIGLSSQWLGNRNNVRPITSALIVACTTGVLILLIWGTDLFAGFLAVEGDIAWYKRFAPELALFFEVLSLVVALLPPGVWRKSSTDT